MSVPGDDYIDPLIKRGEELERRQLSANPAMWTTEAEEAELASIKALARARIAHTQQFPFASTSQEESAQYLAAQEAKSRAEVDAAVRQVLSTLGRLGGPLLLALLKVELTKGLDSLHLPPALAPFVAVVESAALDAATRAVGDVTG